MVGLLAFRPLHIRDELFDGRVLVQAARHLDAFPDQGLTLGQKSTMFLADCLFLAGAFFCADRSRIYKKRLEEADE
ncbi:YrhC family protein [Bacillus velezensis]|uniref:YrhC family protein n=1 Tax=Bacillus velezensis TaxID=492670 RepID=UPI003C6C111C